MGYCVYCLLLLNFSAHFTKLFGFQATIRICTCLEPQNMHISLGQTQNFHILFNTNLPHLHQMSNSFYLCHRLCCCVLSSLHFNRIHCICQLSLKFILPYHTTFHPSSVTFMQNVSKSSESLSPVFCCYQQVHNTFNMSCLGAVMACLHRRMVWLHTHVFARVVSRCLRCLPVAVPLPTSDSSFRYYQTHWFQSVKFSQFCIFLSCFQCNFRNDYISYSSIPFLHRCIGFLFTLLILIFSCSWYSAL